MVVLEKVREVVVVLSEAVRRSFVCSREELVDVREVICFCSRWSSLWIYSNHNGHA